MVLFITGAKELSTIMAGGGERVQIKGAVKYCGELRVAAEFLKLSGWGGGGSKNFLGNSTSNMCQYSGVTMQ